VAGIAPVTDVDPRLIPSIELGWTLSTRASSLPRYSKCGTGSQHRSGCWRRSH